MKQKLLALLVMALFVPLAANAYDACIDGIYYNIVMKAKQATVTYGENEEGTYSEKVVIPEKINYNGIICDVVGIGTRAFTNCKLSNLTLPQSLTKIDQYAFGKYFEVDSLCITDLTSWCNIEFNDEYSNPIRYASALFVNNEKVTNLVIPNGIKSVKNYAFYSAKMLTSVKLSDSVEAIGTKAFYFCSGLKSVTWGKGVTSVGQDAFKECNNIERVNISDLKAWLSVDFGISSVYGSLGEGIYRFIQNPLYYAGHLYLNGSELTDVVVPDGIETLWAHAFEGYTAITSLVIPDGVKDFKSRGYEGSTLSDCHNLRSVKIGAGLKEMQILNCASLTSLEVGDGKIKIEISKCPLLKESGIKIYNAQDIEIEQCNAITELTLANIVNATNKFNIYSCSGLKKLQIPDGVSSAYVRNCPALTTLILGMGLNGLTVDGCKELTDVYNPMTTPKHVSFGFGNDCLIEYATLHIPGESIDAYKATEPWSKFGTIIALKEGDPGYADNPNVGGIITFADSRVGKICVDNWDTNDDGKLSEQEAAAVKSIGTVFKDNTQLVTFYELKYFTGLTAIDDDSFNGCTNLKNISIPETVTSFGNRAFYNCANLKEMILPSGVTDIGFSAFSGCKSLTEIVLPNSVKTIGEYTFFCCYSLTSLTLSKGLTKIANNAFVNCPALMRIDIPDGIVEIGDNAFGKDMWYSGDITREQVTIPNSVKKIGTSVFSETTVRKLFLGTGITEVAQNRNIWGEFEEINIPSLTNWLSLPSCVVSGSPFRMYINGSELKNVTIPEGTKEISDYRFYNCISINKLIIPSSVSSIGARAFSGCTGLVSLDFSERVKIGQGAFTDCTGIISILLPENEQNGDIDMRAFMGCSGLKDVFCPIAAPISIQENYGNLPLNPFPENASTLHVPAESVDLYKKAIGWRKFANIVALQEGDPGYVKPNDGITLTAKSYTRQYGEANPTFEYEVTEGTITYGTPEITCEATATSPVGTYDIIISKGTVSNNCTVNLVKGTLTITKAPLTISAGNYNKVEGEDNPEFTPTFSGFKNGETKAVLTKQPVITTTATNASKAGSYPVTASGAGAQNYSITYENGTLTVTEPIVDVTLTAKSYTREYGEANPKFEYEVTEGTLTDGTPTITCSATATSPVGTYDIVISKGTVGNNGTVNLVKGTLTITKAPLTIAAGNYMKEEGEDNPRFTPVFTGFKNNETKAVLTKQPTITTTATKTSKAGSYPVTVSGAEAQNYSITYENGTLIVTEKEAPKVDVTLTAMSYTREYGEANPMFEYTVSDGIITSGTPTITCSATATSPVGTYDIVISKGTVGNNGTVNLVKGTLTITKAPLTIAAGNYMKEEGEDNPEFTPVFNGFKNGETKDVLTKQPTITTTATKASKPGNYPVTISGAEAQNYEITYEPGTLTVTEPIVDVTLTAKSYTREYGEANPTFEYDVTDGTITSGTPEITCEATATSPVGTYDIVISKGTVSNNGTVNLVKGTLTITKAPLTISVGDYTKEEGEDNPEFIPVFTGFKNNETEDVLTKQPIVTSTATKDSPAGVYEITVSGAEAHNYSISYQSGTLTVTEKPVELEAIEGESTMNTDALGGRDLSDNVVGNIYYVIGENGYDSTDKSIVISQTTNMGQIADKEPGSKDVKENFNGMILKVAKGKGLITVNVKTSGNAQLVVQVGNGTPMLASKTEKGDVVFSYDVEEDTYVYIYAIIGSSAAKGYGLNVTDTDSSVRIYSITVSPGATGIKSIGGRSATNDDTIYDLQGRRVKNTAKGVYIVGGRKYSVK